MNELIPAFEQSLFNSSFSIGIDISEVLIDTAINDSIFKDIPIVNTIVNLGKFAQNIYDRNLISQTVTFINEFNKGVNSDKVEKHRKKLNEKPKLLESELSRVLILLNKNIDIIKSKYEARFYAAYVNEKLSWDDFCELCDITDRLFLSDIICLEEAYKNEGVNENMSISYKHERLIAVGLLESVTGVNRGPLWDDIDLEEAQIVLELTEIGNKFCQIAFI